MNKDLKEVEDAIKMAEEEIKEWKDFLKLAKKRRELLKEK